MFDPGSFVEGPEDHYLGLWLSYEPFNKEVGPAPPGHSGNFPIDRGEQRPGMTEIEAWGIKVKTSVLGVVTLFLSLAFFFLYIVYVFPVSFVK
jgi:hypothetical protein